MTTQQQRTITAINADLAADRWVAAQASREQAALIEESVIIAVEVKIAEGRMSEARALWLSYKASKKGN